jgi:hypothetical protein
MATCKQVSTAAKDRLKTLHVADWKIQDKAKCLIPHLPIQVSIEVLVLFEEAVGHELVMIGCLHHVMEVILSSVLTAVFGANGGPDVGLFKRFQTK